MKTLFTIIALTTGLSLGIHFAQLNNGDDLTGSWTIDLRPTPDSEAYYQKMEINSVEDNRLSGSFYGSEILSSKLNRNWNKLYFAFTTSDGSHTYYHSAYLQDGKLHGFTYCPGRDLAMPWTGIN